MTSLLERLQALYGDVPESLRVTDEGIWHGTPLNVLATAVEVIERAELVRRGDTILDAGAGDGRVLAALALGLEAMEVTLIGIECDAVLVEQAQERLASLSRPPTVKRGDYFSDVPNWPRLTMHYPDGNEHALLRFIDEKAGIGARLLVLSPEIAPNLGRAPARRWEVRPADQVIAWSLSLYER